MKNLVIRRAERRDAKRLTEISFAAKRYWNYPEAYFEIWRKELTITEEYIVRNDVFTADADLVTAGYYSIVHVPEGFQAGELFITEGHWLEHIFIEPAYIGRGIGRRLVEHGKKVCREKGLEKLKVLADPHSRGFYEKIGARYVREEPSNIAGRTVSYFEIVI